MKKSQIVAHFLVPADQHAPEAIHPTMRPLHDPPPRPEPSVLLQRFGLFPPRSDVGGEPEFGEQGAHFIIVIAFVQAHPLRPSWGWLWPRDRDTGDGLSGHLEVMAIRALDGDADELAIDAFGSDALERFPARERQPPQCRARL